MLHKKSTAALLTVGGLALIGVGTGAVLTDSVTATQADCSGNLDIQISKDGVDFTDTTVQFDAANVGSIIHLNRTIWVKNNGSLNAWVDMSETHEQLPVEVTIDQVGFDLAPGAIQQVEVSIDSDTLENNTSGTVTFTADASDVL